MEKVWRSRIFSLLLQHVKEDRFAFRLDADFEWLEPDGDGYEVHDADGGALGGC